jgi:hypothetical protein
MPELQWSERLKTPLNAQKHEMDHNDVGRSSSKRKHQGAKKGGLSGGNSIESSGQKTNLAESRVVAQNLVFLRRERGRNIRVF